MNTPHPNADDPVLKLVSETYDEVLDATKHQDDKIGRLFTGISFLTAAALALANVGGGAYVRQGYRGWSGPPLAVVFLSVFLVLVVLSVMLLINSLATPLRTPGLSRKPPKPHVDWVNGIEASPIYFGEISKLRLVEWRSKWDGSADELRQERRQSLIGETHNLAARTQFKYGRTSEAIAIFNLALLSLSCTIVLVLTASAAQDYSESAAPTPALPSFPLWPRFALAVIVAIFYFVQLQGSVRYTRQTLDEIQGSENAEGAFWQYWWVCCASVWAFLVASGLFRGWRSIVVILVGATGIFGLFRGTQLRRRQLEVNEEKRAKLEGRAPKTDGVSGIAWGSWLALSLGSVLTLVVSLPTEQTEGYEYAFGAALTGATAIVVLSLIAPTLAQHRVKARYEADLERKDRAAKLESLNPNAAGH